MRIEQTPLLNIPGQGHVEIPTRDMALSASKRSDKIELALSKPAIDAVADVRRDRVEAVRVRVESGFYDRPEVREEIAGQFLKAQTL